MIEYTGPIPPEPGAPFDAVKWQIWQAYQHELREIALANEREARYVVTDEQHRQKMEAEAACSAASIAQAEGQKALAAGLRYSADHPDAAYPAALEHLATAAHALATSISTLPGRNVPIDPPIQDPAPIDPPIAPVGLVAETLAVARKWAAVYAAPPTSP